MKVARSGPSAAIRNSPITSHSLQNLCKSVKSVDDPSQRSTFLSGAGLFALSLVPAMVLFPWIVHTWVNIPFHDDWGTPGHQLVLMCEGKLGLSDLFSQHNESRPFFPRLVLIPLAWFGGWDVRRAICAIFAMAGVASVLLHLLVRKMPGMTRAGTVALSLVMNLVLFWPNSEIWNFSNTFLLVWPPVALLAALLVNLSGASLRGKVLWNSLFATISTYSWANGMLLWVLAAPVPDALFRPQKDGENGKAKRGMKWYPLYALAAVVNIVCYFFHYRKPPDNPPFSWDPGKLADYFFTWAGGLFGNEFAARWIGAAVALLFLVFAGICVRAALRKRDFTGCYPWLVPGMYAVISGVMASVGRSGFGASQAMSPRYTAVSGYLYIAVAGLGCLAWQELSGRWTQRRQVILQWIAMLGALACTPFLIGSYEAGFRMLKTTGEHRRALATAWEWSKVIPQNPALALILPNTKLLNTFGSILEEHHVLRLHRWNAGTGADWVFTGKAVDTSNGIFGSCETTPDGWVAVSGWASLPGRAGPADAVLLTIADADGAPRPWTILPSNLDSPDVAKALKNDRMARCAFRMGIPPEGLPKGRIIISAWAVDVKQAKVRPLARSFVMNGE